MNGAFLSQFGLVIYGERGNGSGGTLPANVAASLEAYIQAGGDLLVTGYDTLGGPTDTNLANLVRALTPSDLVSGQVGWITANINNPILNGPFGDFRNLTFNALGYDDDAFTPNSAAGAVALATMPSGQTRLLFTDLPGGAGSVGTGMGVKEALLVMPSPTFTLLATPCRSSAITLLTSLVVVPLLQPFLRSPS